MSSSWKYLALIGCMLSLWACKNNKADNQLFQVLSNDSTGIHFNNQLKPTSAFNLFSYMYYYNGAGIGAGDFNNDGLTDLFFAANQGNNALYLNRGKMHFEDVTNLTTLYNDTTAWSTGVSVIDINNDGLLDVYICRVGNYKILKGKNQLLVNQGLNANGIPQFKDEAASYGIDFSGFSTQAAFVDYDLDGDVDMFLLNHSVNHDGNYAPRSLFTNTFDSLAGHRFYLNENNHFRDVTKLTGIHSSKIGYGLGVVVSDINMDGWPDIYVGNDFHENDYLYINQKNGSFKDESTNQLMHTSQFTMGVDAADINNDAYPDIISMDMLPYESYMLKRSLSEDDYNIFQHKLLYGYSYQYARNNLQLNNRNGLFSEIGQYAGLHSTDWSWAALWMDFNNDGNKDLFVTNGIPKRMNDIDYINFVSGGEIQQKLTSNSIQDKDLALIKKFPEIKIPNQFFINKGNTQFANFTDSIANNPLTFSNGAAYTDLDNDGDLDIVVNNINDQAMIYRNNTNQNNTLAAFVKINPLGFPKNKNALGTKVILFSGNKTYLYEKSPVHGFLSSMNEPLLIGLKNIKVDSTYLIWPNNQFQKIDLKTNTLQSINYTSNLPYVNYDVLKKQINKAQTNLPDWKDVTSVSGINYVHKENPFNEFDREPLIPHMTASEGPATAIADINHDGLEDIFIGSSKGNHPVIYVQQKNNRFVAMPQPALQVDSMWEHIDAQWVDVNQDKHVDLVIATGGNEYYGTDEHLLPLLYLNDGSGNLTRLKDAFSDIYITQSQVVTEDFNGDGFPDLFIAGRTVPWQYGITPRSYLLQNDGTGHFKDVTAGYSSALVNPGMVTSAQWVDFNKDLQKDLLLTYEWGGIELFIKDGNKFKPKDITTLHGWWQFAYSNDIDKDGDLDIIAGNLGLNTRLKASIDKPVCLYINDFDDNGRIEQIMTYYVGAVETPFSSKIQLEKQLPLLKKKYLYAEDFAKASLQDLFGKTKLNNALKLTAACFENVVLINDGKLNFNMLPLPNEAQFSTYKAALVLPNSPQILLMGNYYNYNVELGKQDADFGTFIQFQNQHLLSFQAFANMPIKGQVNKLLPIKLSNTNAYLIIRNNESAMLMQTK